MTGGGGAEGGGGDAARGATAAPVCGRNAGIAKYFSDDIGVGTAADGGFLPPALSSIL